MPELRYAVCPACSRRSSVRRIWRSSKNTVRGRLLQLPRVVPNGHRPVRRQLRSWRRTTRPPSDCMVAPGAAAGSHGRGTDRAVSYGRPPGTPADTYVVQVASAPEVSLGSTHVRGSVLG